MATPCHCRRHALGTFAAIYVFLAIVAQPFTTTTAIGVNYGTKGDNLAPPSTVAAFLANRTRIDRVKLFDTNPDMLRAFAGTGISVMVTAANGDIPILATTQGAAAWVASNVAPFYPATEISLVAVGNEIMDTHDPSLIDSLVPAMRTLKAALAAAAFRRIRVSTPNSLGILVDSSPPSAARFRDGWDVAVFTPMLQFLQRSKSPLVVNAYPYFGYNGDTLPYALARPNNPGVADAGTGITYTSMFEAQLDSVYSAMKKLGFEDVEILVGETGWPTKAMDGQIGVSPAEAAEYNRYLINEVGSGSGTPLMPKRTFETYIFALFNEDLKPGPVAERNFGLFQPDFTPMYDVGIMKGPVTAPAPAAPAKAARESKASAPTEVNGSSSAMAPSMGESTDHKTPEAAEGGDAPPSSAKSGPGDSESSEAAAKDDQGNSEKTSPREGSTTPPPDGAASKSTSFLFHVSCILAIALSVVMHV
ncbi:glucan endo-1,3-beta-glucosidase isoform X2 [Brachypodium distachyon]|uniref:glucan endo-1,3-beta-D-glucosidase n=1 Tax=Brachypodium distachyon TaxID=15368 RepID=I1H2H7_BRADI|nr:glucan endo-1,3-beta-glucosidase isoform X2 [Brachypodium distachyon]KQK20290.1 hypothetical protein BRADI_1g53590v3 [Brachypodium distachyon]|eukprot:XP_003561280.1 glucan endo-1,3-beta-glucosidase isoform X2 [Brachypodium distachyon]